MNETESGRTESLCIAHVIFPSFVSCCAVIRRSPYARSLREIRMQMRYISLLLSSLRTTISGENARAAVFVRVRVSRMEKLCTRWTPRSLRNDHALCQRRLLLFHSLSTFLSRSFFYPLSLSFYFLSLLSIHPVNHTWFLSPRRVGRRLRSTAITGARLLIKPTRKTTRGSSLSEITFRLTS